MNRFFAVLILVLCTACSASKKPNIAGLSYICGTERVAGAAAVVMIQTPDGENLSAADIQELRAQFRGPGGVAPLVPTLHGCLVLPAEAGVVEIQSPRAAWGLARSIGVESAPRFVRWNLEKGGLYQFKLNCPSEGIFTSPRLSLPILGQVEGAPELFNLQLILRDAATDQAHLVYEKKLGQPLTQLPEAIDLMNLPEGAYTLDVRLRDLTRDWDAADPSRVQSCPVTLVRSVPGLSGTSLVTSLGLEVYRRGDTLPLTVSDPRSRLYVCRERAAAADECEAQAECLDPEHFTLASTVTLDDTGTFRYFLQAENVVKVRSRPVCHKVFVSASAPVLMARWKAPVIDEENTVLREPQALLGLNIAVQHPVVPGTQIEDSLQCRAEFLVGGLLTRKGADVTCMSGRCKGKSLENWQPCDTDLTFSIASALQIPNVLNSQLRLSIRTSDGAGQTQEITKSVWLQKSRWNMKLVSTGDVYESALAADGSLIEVKSQGQTIRMQVGSDPEVIPSPLADAWGVTLAQLADRSVIGFFRGNEQNLFAVYEKGQWQPLSILGWDPTFAPCSRLIPDEGDTFICSAQGSLTRMRRDRVIQRVTQGPSCLGVSGDSVARLGAEDYVVNCRRSLHRYTASSDQWQEYDLWPLFENPDIFTIPQIADGALERDGLGRVWFMAFAGQAVEVAAAYIDASGLHQVQTPIAQKPDFPALALARNSRGQIQVMDRVWDESSRSWQVLSEIQATFPGNATIRVRRFADGALLYESEHLLLRETAEGMRSLYPWKGLDLPTRSAIENFQQSSNGSTYIHAAFGNTRRLYQFQLRSWASFGGPFLNLEDVPILPFNLQDKIRIQSVSQGSFALEEGAWVAICGEWKGHYSTPFATSQGLYLGAFDGLLHCNPQTKNWESVFAFEVWDDLNDWLMPSAANVVEDQWGRIWFGKRNGRMVYREGDQLRIFEWPEDNGVIDNLMLVHGRVATLGYNKLTIWNEEKHQFDVSPLSDLNITEEFWGKVKGTAQGLLIYAPDADHFRVLDRNQNTERTEKGMSGCEHFLSTRTGSLICLTWDSVYQQIPGQDWVRAAGGFTELDFKRAILEKDRYLWVPVGHDLVRIDLPEAFQ